MARAHHCWRCKTVVPMLEKDEWARMSPRLLARIDAIKEYRRIHGVNLTEARRHVDRDVLDLFLEMTGFEETNAEAIWHHRLDLFGPPCPTCGHLLRTPRASFCAACGAPRTSSQPE